MTEVGIRALKQNASSVVAEAAEGECVTITVRGRAVARIVPLATTRMEALMAAGRVRLARRRISELQPPARRRRGRPRLSEALEEVRQAERY